MLNFRYKTSRGGISSESGFTVVEFLISTAVFSVVLLICSFAILHIGRMYYKGVITSRTQDAARRIVEDVAASIQYGEKDNDPLRFMPDPITSGGSTTYCLGDTRYTYISDTPLDSATPHVLWRDERTRGCGDDLPNMANPSGGQEMVGRNMRITSFSVQRPPVGGSLWAVSITVSYGDDNDLFEDSAHTICKGVQAGGQFCAVSSYTTSVIKRL